MEDNQAVTARSRWVFWAFIAIAGFFLVLEHKAHLLAYWPFLLLAACPVLHLFHHRHGGHGRGAPHEGRSDKEHGG